MMFEIVVDATIMKRAWENSQKVFQRRGEKEGRGKGEGNHVNFNKRNVEFV